MQHAGIQEFSSGGPGPSGSDNVFFSTQLTLQTQGSKIALVRSYARVPQAAGQVEILIILVKIIFFLYMSIIFVMQGKCLFSDISRPETTNSLFQRKLSFFKVPEEGPTFSRWGVGSNCLFPIETHIN